MQYIDHPEITAAILKDTFSYDPAEGILRWKHGRRRGRTVEPNSVGAPAGTPNTPGYRQVRVMGKRILAHRIVWCMVHGSWPPLLIDHINGDKEDNRISNLRLATQNQNCWNRKTARNSKTGITGVYFHKARNKYGAAISVNGVKMFLGFFDTREDARKAREDAERVHYGQYSKLTTGLLANIDRRQG